MRVAVEDREEADQRHRGERRDAQPQRDREAENHDRQRDADLDVRHADACDAERAADRHDADEARRHQPERASAEQRRIEADRHHRQHVVEPADRMHEAVREAVGIAETRMRRSCGSQREKRGRGGRSAHCEGRHRVAFVQEPATE